MRGLMDKLPLFLKDELTGEELSKAREIRVRKGWPVEIRYAQGGKLMSSVMRAEDIEQILSALTDYSLYAWEEQIKEGFFTLPGGYRVGVTGRYAGSGDALQEITSVSVRLMREIPDAGDGLLPFLTENSRVVSTLILSPPGMGKTTLLRALVGRISGMGYCVSVCDERGELSGRILGARSDVAVMCDKRLAIPRFVRSLAPDVIATDEIGGQEDAKALGEAARCGVTVLATAHARDYGTATRRGDLKEIIHAGIFARYCILGKAPGHIQQVLNAGGETLWMDGA